MNIVIINGSARKGNTLTIIDAFIKGASEKNENVSLAIFDKYDGFGTLKSVQITGKAELIEPFSAA